MEVSPERPATVRECHERLEELERELAAERAQLAWLQRFYNFLLGRAYLATIPNRRPRK